MKVVLAGATGFLGRRAAEALLRGGHSVVAAVRSSSDLSVLAPLDALRAPGASLSTVDLDEAGPAGPFAGGADAALFAAACYGRGGEPASRLAEVNTLLPLSLLEAARDSAVPLFVHVDTSLGRSVSPYALSKRQFAEWGGFLCGGGATRFVDVEMEHFYGPGDGPPRFVGGLVASCVAGVPSLDLTEGRQRRDFLHVDDAASALVRILEGAASLPEGVPVPVGSGKPVEVREVALAVRRLSGSRTELRFGAVPLRPREPAETRADLSLMARLGWHPSFTLEEGLRATVEAAIAAARSGKEGSTT